MREVGRRIVTAVSSSTPWRVLSQTILIGGSIFSLLVPWAVKPYTNIQVSSSPRNIKPFEEQQVLQHTPAPGESVVFEHAVKIGAELSGAWLQDHDGFIWFGTFGGGLYRYDGIELKRFTVSNSGLVGSNVTALLEDQLGNIWIGTLSGLCCCESGTGNIVSRPFAADQTNGDTWGIWDLHAGQDGSIWIGTNGKGLVSYSPKHGILSRFVADPSDPSSIPSNNVYRIASDQQGRLLLATFGGGLARWDPISQQVDLALGSDSGLPSTQVWSVLEDSQKRLWIGTQEGLVLYEPESKQSQLFEFHPNDETTLGGPIVTDICEDKHGTFWITTFNGDASLSRLDLATETFSRYGTKQSSPGSLSQRGARTVFEDASGIFWIVSLDGLVKFDRHSVGFSMVSLGSGLLPMYEDRLGQMWLGTIAGLRLFDMDKQNAIPVADRELSRQLVTAFHEDQQGRLWVGVYGGDLVWLDPKTQVVGDRYVHNADVPSSIPESNCIRRVIECVTQPEKLWLLTQGGGLGLFDPESETCQRFVHDASDPTSLCNDTSSYGALLQLADGSLWVGTDNGLDYWDVNTEKFRQFWNGGVDPDSLQSGVIQALHLDKNGTLWVGTSNGLHRLIDFEGARFQRYGVEQGLSDNMVLGILESQQRLWLSTPNGITAFDPSGKTEPQVFRHSDGNAQNDSYLLTSFYKTSDEQFWFGGASGVTHFSPDRLSRNAFVPPVQLTSLLQAGLPMQLTALPSRTQKIEIEWPKNSFAFRAKALSFSMPALNRCRYRLHGYEEDWTDSPDGMGKYTNLPGGRYILQVQGSNSAGVWNQQGAQLLVDVAPPFWGTQWFRTLLLLSTTFGLAAVTKYIAVLNHEVTLRKRSEAQYQESEKRYRSIVEDQEDMIVRFDANGLITFANQAYCQTNGVSLNEVLGKPFSWRIHQDDIAEVKRVMALATTEVPQHASESKVTRLDGTVAYESWIGRALYDESGTLCGYQAIGRDVTEQRKAELALDEKEAQLNHLARVSAAGEMVASIAHEIRQPLTAIAGLSSTASDQLEHMSPESEETETRQQLQGWLNTIGEQCSRINSIIHGLREFCSRGSERQFRFIHEIIAEALALLDPDTHQLHELEVHCPPDLPSVYVDAIQIEQVLVNLVRNACEAMENSHSDSQRIDISAAQEDHLLVVSVQDSGPGIDPDEIMRIFESFHSTKPKGLGLGLSISRSIIEAHGGTLSYVPKDSGATFQFTLPIEAPDGEL